MRAETTVAMLLWEEYWRTHGRWDLFILHLVKDMQLNPDYYMYIKKKMEGRFILHLVKDVQLNPDYYMKNQNWRGGGVCL